MTDLSALRQQTLAAIADAARRSRAGGRARRGARQEGLDLRPARHAWARCRPTSARRTAPRSTRSRTRSPRRSRARRAVLKAAALEAQLEREALDVTLPVRRAGDRDRPHPPDQPGVRRNHRDLRRHGLLDRRRAGHRERRLQFHQAQLPARPSRARDARHVLLRARRQRRAQAAAHAYEPRAGAHDAGAEAADPRRSAPAAPIAATPTRRTRRCSIRSRGW